MEPVKRTSLILRRLRLPFRVLLWISPFIWAIVLLLSLRGLHEDVLLSQARALLVSGHGGEARELLVELRRSPWTGPQARAGLELAAALAGTATGPAADEGEWHDLDASAFPVPLIIRTAFERGEFAAALRLTELAERLGIGTVPLLTAAAWIEAGEPERTRGLGPRSLEQSGNMARRVAHHLTTPEEQGGTLLRDRYGRLIGTAEAGELHLNPHVRPELVPRAVAATGEGERSAGSLRLTLDLEVSDAAFKAFGRYRGSIVILDAATGEILAAVSDRLSWKQGGTPAFEQFREPASIAKLITSTAAWRAGYEPDREFRRMRCRGHERYSGKLLYCPSIVGRLHNLDRALAVSCNVAFANLGVRVGRERLLAEFRRYGFDTELGPFPSGRVVQAHGDDRQLADLAIGLEATEITPLHAALLAAVMANDGVMPQPTLIAAEDGRLGLHPRPRPAAEGRQVIDRRWVPELVEAMEAVVRGGTAQRIWPPHNFRVAMKTGTASDPRYGFYTNYVGIGPMPEARLAFCVRITDRPTSVKVRRAAQQVTYRLLRNLGRIAHQRGWSVDDSLRDRGRTNHPDRLATWTDSTAAPRPTRPASPPAISAR